MKIKYPHHAIENFIKDYVKDYRITTDGEIAINSPYMHDTTYDFRISVEKQCWHDFESDESGNIEKLVSMFAKVDNDEAKKILLKYSAGKETYDEPSFKAKIIRTKNITLPNGLMGFNKEDTRGSLYNRKLALKFLTEKMVNYKACKKYKLKWTEHSVLKFKDKIISFRNRIIIPSYYNDKTVYFQARDYTYKSELRYKNPPKEVQQKNIIVPFYDLILPNEILFISEGPWEAIQYGGTYMLGPGLSDRQVLKIKKKTPKAIYLIPDNDETARRKLIKNIDLIKSYIDCDIFIVKWWINDYKDYKDPIDAKITFDELINSEFIEADKNISLKIKIGTL